MKKSYILILMIITVLGLTACANLSDKEFTATVEKEKDDAVSVDSSESKDIYVAAVDKPSDSNNLNAIVDIELDEGDLWKKIKDIYGFPCRFWLPEGQELFCVYIYEDHAGYLWAAETEQVEYDNLSWTVSGNQIDITGEWEDSFTVDIDNGTATSLSTGKKYEIVKGLTQ